MKGKMKSILLVLAVMMLAISCQKSSDVEEIVDEQLSLKSSHVGEWVMMNDPLWYYTTGDVMYDVCYQSDSYPFYDAAFVSISNDENFVYVKVTTDEDWFIKRLYVNFWCADDPDINSDYNTFPYIKEFEVMPNQVVYKLPKIEECDECLVLNIKILAYKIVDGIVDDEFWWVTSDNQDGSYKFYLDYCWKDCECYPYRTQTPGGWGAPANGNNPGMYRDMHFAEVFPDGLVIGGDYTLTLSSAAAVEAFLPSGGKPMALGRNYLDPDSKSLKNSFAGHLVALTLSVVFDAYDEGFSEATANLGDLVFADGTDFAGMTVFDVWTEANIVFGGGSSQFTLNQLHQVISHINEYYVDGEWTGDGDLFEDCWEYSDY